MRFLGLLAFLTVVCCFSSVAQTGNVFPSSGNVGIGTTSPVAPLDVNSVIATLGDPILAESTISVTGPGTYVIASGGRIHGEYAFAIEGNAPNNPSYGQFERILANGNQYDPFSSIQILENHSYNLNPFFGNFRFLLSSSGNQLYLVMDVTGQGSGTIRVQWRGAADYPYGGAFFGGSLSGGEQPIGTTALAVNEWRLGAGTATPQNHLSVTEGINVDQNDENTGANMFPTYQTTLGISFGDSSGEGIGSARTLGAPNQYGLDFYTGYQKKMVITSPGYVGIGTTTPGSQLEVNGNIAITPGNSSAGLIFNDGTKQTTAFPGGNALQVQTPSQSAYAVGGLIVSGTNLDPSGGYSYSSLVNSGKMLFGWNISGAGGEQDLIANRGPGGMGGFRFYDYSNQGVMTPLVTMTGQGQVGIGTVTPSAPLEVNGNVKIDGTGASITFPDTTVQSTAWNGTTLGGDYAESVDVQGDRSKYEPGDVIVIDANAPGRFSKSAEAYSRLVAGVYSTKPGLVGRRTTAGRPDKDAEVPMAMMGIVPVEVSTENGSIEIGNLLVSSGTPGYAMKGTDGSRMMGAVIGKALAPLTSGKGVIEVLVSLQ